MADRLQWMLELQDRLSGPAARMDRELGRVRSSLKALDIEARQNKLDKITDPLKRQRAELQLQRDKLVLSKAALDKVGGSSRKAASDTGYFVRQLHDVLHIAQIVGGALERMGRVALGVGRAIGKSVSFKQGEMIGLSTFIGGGAGSMFDRLTDFATRTGRSAEEVVGLAKSLSMAGVAAGDIEPILKRIAGLNNISAGSGDTVGRVIANMFGAGKGGAGDIEALRGTAIKPEKLYEDVAERFAGVRNRIAGKMIAENELGLGKNLLTSMILREADAIGATDKAFAGGKTLTGRFDAVEGQIKRMFQRLAGSPGVKAFEKVLGNLADLFNPDSKTGKHTLGALERLSDVFAKVLAPLTGPEGRKAMEAFFDSMIDKVKGALGYLDKLAGIVDALTFGKDTRNKLASVNDAIEERLAVGNAERIAEERRAAHVAEVMSRPGSRPMDSFNRGLAGAEVNVTVHVDARGASKDDAEHIAQKSKQAAIDAVTEALDKAATQKGAQP